MMCTVHLCLDVLSTGSVRTLCYLPSLFWLAVFLPLPFSPYNSPPFLFPSCFLQPVWFLMVGGNRSFKLALKEEDEEFSDELRDDCEVRGEEGRGLHLVMYRLPPPNPFPIIFPPPYLPSLPPPLPSPSLPSPSLSNPSIPSLPFISSPSLLPYFLPLSPPPPSPPSPSLPSCRPISMCTVVL